MGLNLEGRAGTGTQPFRCKIWQILRLSSLFQIFSPVSMQLLHNPSHLSKLLFSGESLQDSQTRVSQGFLATSFMCFSGTAATTFVIINSLILVILALLLFIWLQNTGTFSVWLSAVFPALGSLCILGKYLLDQWPYSWYKLCLLNMCTYSFSLLLIFVENIFQNSSCVFLKNDYISSACMYSKRSDAWVSRCYSCFFLFDFSLWTTAIILLFSRLIIPEPTAGISRQ